jgi:general secretion pathway protein J
MAESRRGFTVLELVVAISIAAIVTAAIATSLSQLGRARDVAHLRMTATRRATDALEHLRRDVQSMLRSDDLFHTRFRLAPETGSLEGREVDRDQLLAFSQRLRPARPIDYSGEGQEYETQYRIETDGQGPSLWRRRDPVPDQFEAAGGVAEPLGDGIVSLRLEAYDGSAWRQEWDSDIDGLPWSVRVTVTASGARMGEPALENPRSLVTLRTEIPIDRVMPPMEEPVVAADAAAEEGAATVGGAMPAEGELGGPGLPAGPGQPAPGRVTPGRGGGFMPGGSGPGRGAGRGGGRGSGGNVPFRPPGGARGPS